MEIEEEMVNQAILRSLRENYREDGRYLNEDSEIDELRYENVKKKLKRLALLRFDSSNIQAEDEDLDSAIRASLDPSRQSSSARAQQTNYETAAIHQRLMNDDGEDVQV